MNLNLLPFMNTMQLLRTDVVTRQKIAAVAIGYASACNCALPSGEVQSASDYYNSNVANTVRRVVSYFNEGVLFDVSMAQEFARNFWLMRYEAVHRCPRMDQIQGNFFCSVFGVAKFFSDENRQFCDQNATDINFVYQSACAIVNQMIKGPTQQSLVK